MRLKHPQSYNPDKRKSAVRSGERTAVFLSIGIISSDFYTEPGLSPHVGAKSEMAGFITRYYKDVLEMPLFLFPHLLPININSRSPNQGAAYVLFNHCR